MGAGAAEFEECGKRLIFDRRLPIADFRLRIEKTVWANCNVWHIWTNADTFGNNRTRQHTY